MPGSLSTEENHSIFDFPTPFRGSSGANNGDGKYNSKGGKNKSKSGKNVANYRNKSYNIEDQQPPATPSSSHPYPSSISIQVSSPAQTSPNTPSTDKNEMRSPATSPGERGKNKRNNNKESRQQNSPSRIGVSGNKLNSAEHHGATFELNSHHEAGKMHFLRNQLSESVDAYSRAIRTGLEELKHRKGVVNRIGTDKNDHPDATTIELGETIASIHFDMGRALEVAGKYAEAGVEFENGMRMLEHTCHKKSERDPKTKLALKEIQRMERASTVGGERKKLQASMDEEMKKLEGCVGVGEKKEAARKNVIACIRRLMRTERDSLGEQSYAVAKLNLKIAKLRCEGGDMEGGLENAEEAIKVLKLVLGTSHTLVGASSLFAATVYEKRVSISSSTPVTCPKPFEQVSSECKLMMNRALELYADALEPLKYKYHSSSEKGETGDVQPDIGDVFHKIGRLYAKKGSYSSAVDAYRRAFDAFGVTWNSGMNLQTGHRQDFHPDAATVWYDLAELHLASKEYRDSLHACEKSTELVRRLMSLRKSLGNERIESLPVFNFQVAGAAHGALHHHEDATRSYQEALSELKKARSISATMTRGKRSAVNLGNGEESKILRKIGKSLLREVKIEEAKMYLIDALRVLRSGGDNERSEDLPSLLLDIGLVHMKMEEFADAINVLQSCIKIYTDQGVPEHYPNVQNARQLLKDAQGRTLGGLNKLSADSFHRPVRVYEAETPLSDFSLLQTPAGTLPTACSTLTNHPSSGSETVSKTGHKQLQSLLEELAEVSPAEGTKDGTLQMQQREIKKLSEILVGRSVELEESKEEINKLKESHASELQTLKSQLRDAELAANRLQNQVKEAEKELDQEKKERVLAAMAKQKETDSSNSSAMSAAVQAKYEAELESLKKELHVSESSYQEILRAIDDEKDQLRQTHETLILELKDELDKLKENSDSVDAKNKKRVGELTQENSLLKERNQKISQELTLMKSSNKTLQSEKDAATLEVASLKAKVNEQKTRIEKLEYPDVQDKAKRLLYERSAAKVGSDVTFSGYGDKVKRLEFELQTERTRRMNLESSVHDNRRVFENDRRVDYDHGVLGWHQKEIATMKDRFNEAIVELSDVKKQRDNMKLGYDQEIQSLEINLHSERANTQVLEDMVRELSESIDKEKEEKMGLIETHKQEIETYKQEISISLIQLEQQKTEIDDLNCSVQQLEDAIVEANEVRNAHESVKEQLLHTSARLASAKEELKSQQEALKKAEEDLAHEKSISKKTRAELDYEKEISQKMEAELTKKIETLSESYERLKKEYLEAMALFESELEQSRGEVKQLQGAIETLEHEHSEAISDKEKELAESKIHCMNVLSELDNTRDESTTDVQNLRAIVETKEDDLSQARRIIEVKSEEISSLMIDKSNAEQLLKKLEDNYAECQRELNENQKELDECLKELNTCESAHEHERNDMEHILTEVCAKLATAENKLKDLQLKYDDIEVLEAKEKILETKCQETSEKCNQILCHLAQQLDSVLPELDVDPDSTEIESLADDCDDDPTISLESMSSRVFELVKKISNHCKNQQCEIEDKDTELERTNGNMSNTLHELDTLATKHTKLKEELAKMNALESDHADLLEQIEQMEVDKVKLEVFLKSESLGCIEELSTRLEHDRKSLQDAQEKRDLFQSRLKEAVDDLEELEDERDMLREEVEQAYQACSQLEKKLLDRIQILEQDNERLQDLDGKSLERDAVVWAKENQLKVLQEKLTKLEMLQSNSTPSSNTRNDGDIYPDLLPSGDHNLEELLSLRSTVCMLEKQNNELCQKLAQSQFDSLPSTKSQDDQSEAIKLLRIDFENAMDIKDFEHKTELFSLRARVRELEEANEDLAHVLANKHEEDTNASSSDESSSGSDSDDTDVDDADSDGFTIASHGVTHVVAQSEKDALLKEISLLKDQIVALEESNNELSAQLAKSRAEVIAAAKTHDVDQEIILDLRNAISETDELLQSNLQYAQHANEQIQQTEEHNQALHRELSELKNNGCSEKLSMLQIDHQNALDDKESNEVRHKQELATLNAEFQTALDSLDGLQKDNKELKAQVNTLRSTNHGKNDDESAYYEKELSNAHSRFVSMETSLQDRISRLEKEKAKLVAAHDKDMGSTLAELTQTKVELSAWKLEMQNALNDTEAMMKERDELKDQIQIYVKSLEAAHMGKAELEEKLHTLGQSRH